MMMDQAHLGEFLLRQQMMHAASLGGLPHAALGGAGGVSARAPACEARLLNAELWRSFHELGTEMIITKGGRRMFPSLRVSLTGLEPREEYCVLIELALVGRRRLRWAGGAWAAAGGAEPQSARRVVLHPDSPASGAHWTNNPVSFGKVKLTNNTMDTQGHMVLTSMHKYRPRVVVVRARDAAALAWGAPHAAFSFPETEFIAVTAYQNDRITKLKIDNNPFAKGFRACGQSKCKRKNIDSSDVGGGSASEATGEAKRACSDAASSCSDEGSLRSASPRTPPPTQQDPPSPRTVEPLADSPPLLAYGDMPYPGLAAFPMPFPGVWGAPCLLASPWSAAAAWARLPPPRTLLPPQSTSPPARRVKSFTIRSLLGES